MMRNMAAKADEIPEIGARCPIDLSASSEFEAAAANAFEAILEKNDPNYGNARYVRNLLHNALNKQIMRLSAKYGDGNIPDSEFSILLAEDMPDREQNMIAKRNNVASSRLNPDVLNIDPESAVPLETVTAEHVETLGHSVMLLEPKKDGRVIGFGSGFVISEAGHILTCAHVARDADEIRARMYWPGLPGGPVFWFDCDILQPIRRDLDLAVLRIRNGSGFVPLNLREAENPVENTEEIMMVGYPFGDLLDDDLDRLKPNYFKGPVCSIQKTGTNEEYVCIDCAGKEGNSGSPVISRRDGRVVGVFDGSKTSEGKILTEEINHFIPLRLFWENFIERREHLD